jgi:hypothetical protein
MQFKKKGLPMTAEGMLKVCDMLDVGEPEIWAVLTVETRGFGFLSDRRPQILFERHIFSKQTNRQFDSSHPGISNRRPGGYKGGSREYDRLEEAMRLDEEATLKSASWGLAQMMGFNFALAGYDSVRDMINAFVDNEDAHLESMGNFILARSNCRRGIQRQDWATFAACYNGPNFRINDYDNRLAAAHAKSSRTLPDIRLRAAQVGLTYLDMDPGPIDGLRGRRTRGAISGFQEANGLMETGELDEDTEAKLFETAFS